MSQDEMLIIFSWDSYVVKVPFGSKMKFQLDSGTSLYIHKGWLNGLKRGKGPPP
jgi:hypothetical protein